MVSPIFRQGLNGVLDISEVFDAFGFSLGSGDFNRDGLDDLAIGVPFEDFLFNGVNRRDAGAVNVLYGSTTGLTGDNDDFWTQGSPGIEEHPDGASDPEFDLGDNFGHSIGVGDFDGDGFADLAVGVPGEDIDNANRSGAVNVIYGASSGLIAAGDQLWHQDQPGIRSKAQAFEEYGHSLTVGDFNGDGRDDLAIGVPGDIALVGSTTISGAGAVNVLYGSTDVGLSSTGNQTWNQFELGIFPNTGDRFGSSIAAGDFDGDGWDDLAVGTPFEDLVNQGQDAGVVNVIYGSISGLAAANSQVWSQGFDSPTDLQGTAEASDRFGSALAVGDFDGDGRDDLAIGVPYDNPGLFDAGAVNVLYGSPNRLSIDRNQIWRQSDLGNTPLTVELFGSSLAVGDFNGDGRDDLVVGTLNDVINGISAGSVSVIYGSSQGLSAVGSDLFHQDTPGVQGIAQAGDRFGSSLGVGDYNGDGFDDLAIGVPGDNPNGLNDVGVVNIIFGSSRGLEVQIFTPN